MIHYTYLITYSDGKRYHGVHSSDDPHSMDYIGSSTYTPDELAISKEVITTHPTRKIANLQEEAVHAFLDIKNDTLYYNESNANAGFSSAGMTKENNPSIAAHADNIRGRTKETHNSIAAAAEKMTGRTKETCPGRASQSEKITGRTKENHPGRASQATKISGRNNPKADLGVYKFHHADNGWTIVCDRQYMKDCFGLDLRDIFKSQPRDLSKGWSVEKYQEVS